MLSMRLHPGSFLSGFLSRYSHNLQHNSDSAFSQDALWQGAGNTDKGKHLKPTSHTNTLLSTTTEQDEKKKNYRKYGHVIYTAFTHFLDLNTNIHLSLNCTFLNLHSPFGSLLTTPQNVTLVPTVL